MLDFHAHVAVLQAFHAANKAVNAPSPGLSDAIQAVETHRGAALLGACLDQLVAHAESDGSELALLEQAADLWQRAQAIYDRLGQIQSGLEAAFAQTPPPDAGDLLAAAIDNLAETYGLVHGIGSDLDALKAAIAPLPHLRRHPRQSDMPEPSWTWIDRLLARRTFALVDEVFTKADSAPMRAFSVGVLAGYAGNVTGSAFLGTVVGGPRRAHRYRDRIARNAVGAALHASLGTPKPSALADAISGQGNLPQDILNLLRHAFETAYPGRTPPDFKQGFDRTLRQLKLLDVFVRPALPLPPALTFAQHTAPTEVLDLQSALETQDVWGNGSDMQPTGPGPADSETSTGAGCGLAITLLTLGLALLIYCIGKWASDEKCKPEEFFDTMQGSEAPDPHDPEITGPTQASRSALEALSQPEAAAHILQELFNMRMMMWQCFDSARAYLAVTGLVYPDELQIGSPLYQQFLETPARPEWPRREDPNARDTYHRDPTSSLEQPTVGVHSQPFPAGMRVETFVKGEEKVSAEALARILLRDLLDKRPNRNNLDLDADRGFMHRCWSVAPGTSINDSAISVVVLPYEAI